MASLRDVAEQAGVSLATASRVVSGLDNVRSETRERVERAMREHWHSLGFIELHSPKLMGSASESGAELFKVDYFERIAYLAQSPQFYKQMAMAAGFGRVFEVGPVFRANPSFTSRHDTEFTSVDVEIAWIDSHEDVMSFEEGWLAHVLEAVKRPLVEDPAGHRWELTQTVRDVEPAEWGGEGSW